MTPRATVESGTRAPNGNAVHKLLFAGTVIRTLTGNGAALEALEALAAAINGPIDARITELLQANNAEVEWRRGAEANCHRLQVIIDRLASTDDRLTVIYEAE